MPYLPLDDFINIPQSVALLLKPQKRTKTARKIDKNHRTAQKIDKNCKTDNN